MSLGLDWINDLALWVGRLFPRWDLLQVNEGGVKYLPGGKVEILEPGIYWWWPATTNIDTIDIRRQAINVSQRLTTKDEESALVNTVIVYEISDVKKALVETTDFEDTIEEVAQKLVIKPIMSREFEQTCRDMSESNEMRNEVTRLARSLLSQYGVNVLDAYVSDFTETTVFSHDGDGIAIGGFEEDE